MGADEGIGEMNRFNGAWRIVFGLTPVVACFAVLSHATTDTETVACPPELLPVRQFVEEAVASKDRSPGAVVMVTRKGETIWAEGFGVASLETGTPVTPDTIFLMASVSKPIAATGLMVLVDEGRVRLDAPANDYLPGAKLRAFAGAPEEITVERLLSHTGGLPIHYNFYYDDSRPTMDAAIARYGYAVYPPGTRWNYSNFGFGVIEYITEIVSEDAWAKFMERRVYDPLGMKGTSDHVRRKRKADRAQPYTVDAGRRFLPVAAYDFDHRGASAVWSSAADLTRFLQMHLNGGELDGVRILSAEAAARMRQPVLKDTTYGLGWFVETHDGFGFMGHTGGMPGVSTAIAAWTDEGVTLVVLTNCDANRGLTSGVQNLVEQHLFTKKSESAPAPAEQPKPDDPKPYAGRWTGRIAHFDGDVSVTMTIAEDGTAKVSLGTNQEIPVRDVQLRKGLTGNIDGKLRVQQGYYGTPVLNFRLESQNADRMTGTVFAAASGYFGVSFWMELDRVTDARN